MKKQLLLLCYVALLSGCTTLGYNADDEGYDYSYAYAPNADIYVAPYDNHYYFDNNDVGRYNTNYDNHYGAGRYNSGYRGYGGYHGYHGYGMGGRGR